MAACRAVIVGAGGISRAWFPPLAKEKVRIPAVVDLDIDRARGRIDEYDLDAEASSDLKAALKKHQPDFVVDLTVPEAHCEVTCTALRAGCHVIGEKPMASSMAEARRMVRAADKAGKLYMVSQSRRWNPLHEQVRRAVAKDKIGPVTSATCLFQLGCRFSGFRAEMDSPLVLDMSIHHFDMARMLTGADPVAVYCHEFNPPGSWSKGDIAASCIFEMTDGVVFTYVGSWCTEGLHTSWNGNWRVTGQKGTIELANDQTPVAEAAKANKAGGVQPARAVKVPPVSMKATGMHGALREMLAYLRRGTVPQTECHDNIKSLAMVFAAIDSSRKGRRVPVKAL
jgi:predicted dehydrogenase